MTPEQIERMRSFVAYFANCPCCDENEKCLNDCTFKYDDTNGFDLMQQAREAMK